MLTIYVTAMSLFLSSCANKPPLVKLHTIDVNHNAVNPYQITKYNSDTCQLELKREPAFELFNNMSINGMICLTPDDYSKVNSWAKTECKNKKIQNTLNEQSNVK